MNFMPAVSEMTSSCIPSGSQQDFGLTARELEVIGLVVAGYTNEDLAQELGIREETAEHHLTNVADKLGVSSRLELILFAVDQNLID
jgi:two-component system, NarL family, nitrate/nitrite response regulator NarL